MKVGVFLTPGAARTAYQVGALRALVEECGLRFDLVAASSVGSLNGAFAATGQLDRLAELWAGWTNRDIMGGDWRALLRGAVWWSTNLMHNRPQRQGAIGPYLHESKLLPGVRLRINLADLTTGASVAVEWPGGPWPLADGVNASVAVPVAIRPVEHDVHQYADGLTVDGFPLPQLALGQGLDRLFVLGVAPREVHEPPVRTAYGAVLRTAEINQYTEITRGLARAQRSQGELRRWRADIDTVLEAFGSVDDPDLAAEAQRLCSATDVSGSDQTPVEIVPILPERPIRMFFTSYQPERSRRLLAQGRRDALAVLESLDG